MFSFIKKTVGFVTATETPTEIIIDGVPGYFIQHDINNIWKTSKVSTYMFNRINKNSFSFPLFFAIEMIYILETIVNHPKKVGTNRNTAKKIIAAIYESTWAGKTLLDHPNIIDKNKLGLFKKTPLPYQDEFFERYNDLYQKYDLKGYLLAGAAGSGKTLMSMMLMEMREMDTVIVICPINALKQVWENSFNVEFKRSPSYWIANGSDSYRGQKYVVAHYESIYKIIELVSKFKGRIGVILDESHNLNEMTSQRTANFIRMCDAVNPLDVLWMSGTPIKALGSESIPLFSTIDKNFTPIVLERFKKLFGKSATKGTDILANRLGIVSHKVEKKQMNLADPIMENLGIKTPDSDLYTLETIKNVMTAFIAERQKHYSDNFKTYKDHYEKCLKWFADHTNSERDLKNLENYKKSIKIIINTSPMDLGSCREEIIFCNKFENSEVMHSIPKEWRADFKNSKSVVKYVSLKIQGECLGRVLGKKRMECIKSLTRHIPYTPIIESTVKKTIVFTSYVEVLEEAKAANEELGFNPVVVYGKTNNELTEIIKGFAEVKSVNPLIATFQSLSTAVPLVMADVMIMLNTPFRDYILQQAISRIHRLGSDTQVKVYIAYLDTGSKPNLSTRTIDILKWSQEQVEKIMNIKSPFEVVDLNASLEDFSDKNMDFVISYEELGIVENFISDDVTPLYEKKKPKW